jgi:hypothetical protein
MIALLYLLERAIAKGLSFAYRTLVKMALMKERRSPFQITQRDNCPSLHKKAIAWLWV